MRINKYLAQCNLGSRRKCEELVEKGLVTVNGVKITELATNILENDIVMVNGKIATLTTNFTYVMLNKPIGYLSSTKDQFDMPSLLKLLPKNLQNLYPVGRLDFNTQGLILLTNDGDFTNKVIHPSNTINKTYVAITKAKPNKEQVSNLQTAMELDGYVISPAKVVSVIQENNGTYATQLIIHEGRNRQVRKMFQKVGLRVIALTRIQIGELKLENLPTGKWRFLKQEDLNKVLR